MPSITCTKCGAKLNTKNPVAAGKKVTCPKCKKLFVVEDDEEPEDEEVKDEAGDEEEEAPPKKKPVKAAKDDDDEEDESDEQEDDEEDAPKKKTKVNTKANKKADNDDDDEEAPKKKGGSGVLIGIIAGVLLLCCIGTSATGWFLQATIKGLFGFADTVAKVKDLGVKDIDTKENDTKDKDAKEAKDKEARDKDGKDGKEKGGKAIVLKPDFTMKPEQIAEEFSKDAEGAAKKYEGKNLEFTGEVKEVVFFGAEKKLGVAVAAGYFGGMDYLLNVPVQPADRQIVYRLSKGQTVKIVAPQQGSFGRFISFDTGSLAEVSKSKIREVPSEKLAADYENDFLSADKIYRDQPILVAGAVMDVKKDKENRWIATLKGNGKTAVQVHGNSLGSIEVDKLKEGKTFVIRAEGCSHDSSKNIVSLGRVTVTDLEPGKTPEPPGPKQMKFTVESLARDVAADRNSFAVKYAGNEAVISGIVESVKKVKTVTTVEFKTDTKIKVSAMFVGAKITATKGGTIEFRTQIENTNLEATEIRFISAKLMAQ